MARAQRYFEGVVGLGAPDFSGAGDVGFEGAAGAALAGTSRITDTPGWEPRRARLKEVIRNRTATAVVILLSTVGVPMDPKTACEPAPPKAEPMSAPFPAWSSTMPMMAIQSTV